MRLLRIGDDGELSLVEHLQDGIPPYAIFSHTWGADTDEVSYQDILSGTGKDKPGYKKILFCAQQATKDSLQYFWVDTCCIDKSNSTELNEAVNSMFRWYQHSATCYVYLSDVSTTTGFTKDSLGIQKCFQQATWFTRAWTLQELLAPQRVEFYSAEGESLGTKDKLAHELHKRTGIPVQALQGQHLSQFSVPERFSWTANRDTRRDEEMAYSILGIFGVHIPLIYGEGRENALRRLQRAIDEQQSYAPKHRRRVLPDSP